MAPAAGSDRWPGLTSGRTITVEQSAAIASTMVDYAGRLSRLAERARDVALRARAGNPDAVAQVVIDAARAVLELYDGLRAGVPALIRAGRGRRAERRSPRARSPARRRRAEAAGARRREFEAVAADPDRVADAAMAAGSPLARRLPIRNTYVPSSRRAWRSWGEPDEQWTLHGDASSSNLDTVGAPMESTNSSMTRDTGRRVAGSLPVPTRLNHLTCLAACAGALLAACTSRAAPRNVAGTAAPSVAIAPEQPIGWIGIAPRPTSEAGD
jgi:hypothetical protein